MRTLKDKAETLAQAARNLYGMTCDNSYSMGEVAQHVVWTEEALRDVRRVVRARILRQRRATCLHGGDQSAHRNGRCRGCGAKL